MQRLVGDLVVLHPNCFEFIKKVAYLFVVRLSENLFKLLLQSMVERVRQVVSEFLILNYLLVLHVCFQSELE